MWSPNELLKTEKQRDILSYITLQFFPFKKVPLEHYPKGRGVFHFCTKRQIWHIDFLIFSEVAYYKISAIIAPLGRGIMLRTRKCIS